MGPTNRPLDLEWLEDFIALAKTSNFSRAADYRAIAQPAFSRHIKLLEEWVGVELINRHEQPISLTAAGQQLLPLINEAIASLEAGRIKAHLANHKEKSGLIFALTHVLSLYYFPHWLNDYENLIESSSVRTMTDSYLTCEEMMLQRRAQFLMCYGTKYIETRLDNLEFPMTMLDNEELIPVGVWREKEIDESTILKGEIPILFYSQDSMLGRILKYHLNESIQLKNLVIAFDKSNFISHSALLIKTMVLAGKGVAWLPKRLIEHELKNGQLIAYGDITWHVSIEIRLYRQKNSMNHIAEQLWDNNFALPKRL